MWPAVSEDFEVDGFFGTIRELFSDAFSKLTGWQVLKIAVAGFVLLIAIVIAIFYYTPKYFTYLEMEQMRRDVLWAETHERIGMIVGPQLDKHPNLPQYLLIEKLERTDVESIGDK